VKLDVWMKRLGLSQEEAISVLKISRASLQAVLRGERCGAKVASAIAKATNGDVPLSEVIDGTATGVKKCPCCGKRGYVSLTSSYGVDDGK